MGAGDGGRCEGAGRYSAVDGLEAHPEDQEQVVLAGFSDKGEEVGEPLVEEGARPSVELEFFGGEPSIGDAGEVGRGGGGEFLDQVGRDLEEPGAIVSPVEDHGRLAGDNGVDVVEVFAEKDGVEGGEFDGVDAFGIEDGIFFGGGDGGREGGEFCAGDGEEVREYAHGMAPFQEGIIWEVLAGGKGFARWVGRGPFTPSGVTGEDVGFHGFRGELLSQFRRCTRGYSPEPLRGNTRAHLGEPISTRWGVPRKLGVAEKTFRTWRILAGIGVIRIAAGAAVRRHSNVFEASCAAVFSAAFFDKCGTRSDVNDEIGDGACQCAEYENCRQDAVWFAVCFGRCRWK